MSDAQHTQEKEALEDASNRLLVVDGIVIGTLAYTMIGTWTTKDGGVVTGPGYTVAFRPSADAIKAIALLKAGAVTPPVSGGGSDAGGVPPAGPADPPTDPKPPETGGGSDPGTPPGGPSEPPPTTDPNAAPNIGAVQPGDVWQPPEA